MELVQVLKFFIKARKKILKIQTWSDWEHQKISDPPCQSRPLPPLPPSPLPLNPRPIQPIIVPDSTYKKKRQKLRQIFFFLYLPLLRVGSLRFFIWESEAVKSEMSDEWVLEFCSFMIMILLLNQTKPKIEVHKNPAHKRKVF